MNPPTLNYHDRTPNTIPLYTTLPLAIPLPTKPHLPCIFGVFPIRKVRKYHLGVIIRVTVSVFQQCKCFSAVKPPTLNDHDRTPNISTPVYYTTPHNSSFAMYFWCVYNHEYSFLGKVFGGIVINRRRPPIRSPDPTAQVEHTIGHTQHNSAHTTPTLPPDMQFMYILGVYLRFPTLSGQ